MKIKEQKRLKVQQQNWDEVHEKLLQMELEVHGHNIVLLAIYSRNNDATNMKDDFKKEPTILLDTIGNQKEIFLVGDMQGKVGQK